MKITTLIILIAFVVFSFRTAVAVVPTKISGKNLPGGSIIQIVLALAISGLTVVWSIMGETLTEFYKQLLNIVFSILGEVEKDGFWSIVVAAVAIFLAAKYFLVVGNLPQPQNLREAGINLASIVLLFVFAAPIAAMAGDSLISAITQAEEFAKLEPFRVLTEFLE